MSYGLTQSVSPAFSLISQFFIHTVMLSNNMSFHSACHFFTSTNSHWFTFTTNWTLTKFFTQTRSPSCLPLLKPLKPPWFLVIHSLGQCPWVASHARTTMQCIRLCPPHLLPYFFTAFTSPSFWFVAFKESVVQSFTHTHTTNFSDTGSPTHSALPPSPLLIRADTNSQLPLDSPYASHDQLSTPCVSRAHQFSSHSQFLGTHAQLQSQVSYTLWSVTQCLINLISFSVFLQTCDLSLVLWNASQTNTLLATVQLSSFFPTAAEFLAFPLPVSHQHCFFSLPHGQFCDLSHHCSPSVLPEPVERLQWSQ